MREKELKVWLKKIESFKSKDKSIDLSKDEDLSIALMNLVSLEEHFYFSAMKANDKRYLDMLKEIRKMRKNLLGKLVRNPNAEEWCISKHLLGASMRLIEVGNKELSDGNEKEANEMFKDAFDLYSLFFGINLKLVRAGELEKINGDELREIKKEMTMTEKLGQIVKKIVDCCKE